MPRQLLLVYDTRLMAPRWAITRNVKPLSVKAFDGTD